MPGVSLTQAGGHAATPKASQALNRVVDPQR